jgi:hypothetical protein
MKLHSLYDRIVLTEDLPDKGLMKGDIGTIVTVYGANDAYEIEFFTLQGKTRTVETLLKSQVRPVGPNEVATSRLIA